MSQTLHQAPHQQLVELRARAKDWLEGGTPRGFYLTLGICENIALNLPALNFLRGLMAQWPDGTGSELFPVPHPTKSPEVGFNHSSPQEMWNPEFEYARNRWALLEWLIEQTASEADQPVAAGCVEGAA